MRQDEATRYTLERKKEEVSREVRRITEDCDYRIRKIHSDYDTKKNTDVTLMTNLDLYEKAEADMKKAILLLEDRAEAISLAQQWTEQNVETNRLTDVIKQAKDDLDPAKNPDPYTEQIESLRKNALADLRKERTKAAEARILVDHFQLLVDLATKKDSFIRKQLVERWLPHLNRRIAALLQQLELPHRVRFDSEMDMHVELNKGEYQNGNLSKGERTRLIVAVNLAFQELFEQMNYRINLLIVDELIDSGICNRGAENAVRILNDTVKKHQKRAFLITHRSDIRDQVDSTLTVFKENDFSHLRWDDHDEPVRS